MRNSLIFKLMGAFLLVIAIGALVISISTALSTRSAFTLYTTRSGQAWAQQLAPRLADYYAQTKAGKGSMHFSNPVRTQVIPSEWLDGT